MFLVDPIQHELCLLYRTINKILLGHVRPVAVDCLDQFPGAQQCGCKQNGVLPFLGHIGLAD